MDGGGIFGVGFAVDAVGVMTLGIAPVTYFEAELTMEGFLGGHAVKFGEPALFAKLADHSFPLGRLGYGSAWGKTGDCVFTWGGWLVLLLGNVMQMIIFGGDIPRSFVQIE